jgi:hypothetical protein
MIMGPFSKPSRNPVLIVLFLACLTPGLIIAAAAGADVSIDGYLGETITLHGVSYVGGNVYLFLTGPNLPANGVTLTDISQRADQGHFTVVPVDSNQEWAYKWQTSRIEPDLDPGTYIVYVTNEQADLSHLGGTSSYKTLSVFLKDPGTSKVSVNSGNSYTLRPESHISTPVEVPSLVLTTTVPATTPPAPETTLTVPAAQAPPPVSPTKAGIAPFTALVALIGCCWLVLRRC